MKFKAYERPDLEELELILEGSFLDGKTGQGETVDPDNPDLGVEEGEGDGNWN